MKCSITFVDPSTGNRSSVVLEKKILVGRDPGKGGFVVGHNDQYVSSIAIELSKGLSELLIWNRSSHSHIDIRLDTGLRMLFPGEKLSVHESTTIIITSDVYIYQIEALITELIIEGRKTTGTQKLDGHDLVLAEERIPTLCGLCASYFYPEKYGVAPLTANQIAERLKRSGSDLTSKAVNNKIQRTRDQVEEASGLILDDREALAQYLIRRGNITKEMIDRYF